MGEDAITFTRPYFGTARSRSKTFAVSTYSGGSRSSPWIWARPALRSRFSLARRVRMSFARCRASMRWVRDRSGARPAECVLAGDWEAAGMGGDSTRWVAGVEGEPAKNARIHLDLDLSFRLVAGP